MLSGKKWDKMHQERIWGEVHIVFDEEFQCVTIKELSPSWAWGFVPGRGDSQSKTTEEVQ